MSSGKNSESSGSKVENEQENSTSALPSSLSASEKEKFYWFTRGAEVGVCSAGNILKNEGRKELFTRVMSLLDRPDYAQLISEMWWQLMLDWVKNGQQPVSEDFSTVCPPSDLILTD